MADGKRIMKWRKGTKSSSGGCVEVTVYIIQEIMYVYISPDGSVSLSRTSNARLLMDSQLAFKTTLVEEGLDLIKFENLKIKNSRLIQTFTIPIIDLA